MNGFLLIYSVFNLGLIVFFDIWINFLYHQEDEWNTDVKYYRRLCRGEEIRSPQQKKGLTCRYVHDHSPFLTIAPLKLEVLNEVPYIAQYYDVIYDSEIAELKHLAMPNVSKYILFTDLKIKDFENIILYIS